MKKFSRTVKWVIFLFALWVMIVTWAIYNS